MGKPHRALFHEFKGGSAAPDDVEGSGDVKYHLGASSDREFDGNNVHLSLTANPSHLETVDPVVLGKVRAKQDQHGATPDDRTMVLPLLMHGDAAFAGQGVVAECFGLSGLKGYRTGGSIHFIVNNQIGFTTYPRYSRSSPYPSDVAKMIQAPIFHVNGDDPEAVVYAAKVATEFRQKFQKPVVIDMFCYRRYGHNEGDEPAFTQPLMYKAIRAASVDTEIYSKKLIDEGVVTEGEVEKMKADWRARLEAEYEAGTGYKPNKADWLDGHWAKFKFSDDIDDPRRGNTGVAIETLKEVGQAITTVPEGFHVHRTIQRFLETRRKAIETGEGIDWATGEALAFGTLLLEGHRVRLSGQDSERGTFSQRHSVLIDQESEARYTPFNHLAEKQGNSKWSTRCSPRRPCSASSTATRSPSRTRWPCGKRSSATSPTARRSSSTSSSPRARSSGCACRASCCLLPHGYEGQGPEHSSARLERFLQMCAEDNMQVANCTTPANYFHILRRQMQRKFRKPLILMTPKSLLRHKRAVSQLAEFGPDATFHRVLWDDAQTSTDREDQARAPTRRSTASSCAPARSITTCSRSARSAARRHPAPAPRAALSVPRQGADRGADALPEGRDRLVPGRAAEQGRVVVRRHLHREGAAPDRRRTASALCRPPATAATATGLMAKHQAQLKNLLEDALENARRHRAGLAW